MVSQKQGTIKKIAQKDIKLFLKTVRTFEKKFGLRRLPWRTTTNPYRIAISELMLQQTQAPRVVPKYQAFLKAFPNVTVLANAPTRDVLALWNGLGYNRRALFAQKMARKVVTNYGGKFPKAYDELVALTGIGPYTANAILTFCFNQPVVLIEANIRTIFLHHFFSGRSDKVTDEELLPFIKATLDTKNPRHWYNLLMDYGTYLKKEGIVTHRKSSQYVKQKAFEGSLREVRGYIVRVLLEKPKSLQTLVEHSTFDQSRIEAALAALKKEGLVSKKGEIFSLART